VQHEVILHIYNITKLEQYKKSVILYIYTEDLQQKYIYRNKKNIIYKNSTSSLMYKDIFLRSGTLQSESNPPILEHVHIHL
jgi:hypothetical protein